VSFLLRGRPLKSTSKCGTRCGTIVVGSLNDRKCRTAGPGRHGDGNRLFLVVSAAGARKWVFALPNERRAVGYGAWHLSRCRGANLSKASPIAAPVISVDPCTEYGGASYSLADSVIVDPALAGTVAASAKHRRGVRGKYQYREPKRPQEAPISRGRAKGRKTRPRQFRE
jgi:hypothetical protein